MTAKFSLTMDASDVKVIESFWCQALGYVPEAPPEGFATWPEALTAWGMPEEKWDDFSAIVDPDGDGPRIFLQRVPEPKTSKNRLHLDVLTDARREDGSKDVEVLRRKAAELVEAGGAIVREFDEPTTGQWIVMTDPDGNEFCVC